MEMFQSILVIILLAIWLVFSIVFLITAVQNLINDRRREQREVEKDKLMKTLSIDIETFSDVQLPKTGVYRYC